VSLGKASNNFSRKGMTLLEVIVAMLIVSSVASSALVAFVGIVRSSVRAQARNAAVHLAQHTLEDLKDDIGMVNNTWPISATLDPGLHDTATDPNNWLDLPAGPLRDLYLGSRSYFVTNLQDVSSPPSGFIDYKRVRVTITWTTPG